MNLRSLSVVCIAGISVVFTACPKPPDKADANDITFDAGNPPERDACSGGCAGNQVCDVARKTCVDGCGGCDAGTCVKVSDGVFQCRALAVACSGTQCQPGQVACLGGECACISSLSGALDSCRAAGKWCSGRACATPREFQQCKPGDPDAKCPMGSLCQPVFGQDTAICVRGCTSSNNCNRGEICWSGMGAPTGGACLPSGLFGLECGQNVQLEDGGFVMGDAGMPLIVTMPVSNTCLLLGNNGVPTEAPGKGTGNCTYAMFQLWDNGNLPFETCRPPGNATEGQPCRTDYKPENIGTQCSTGLQCVPTKGGDDGVCLRMCNAQPPALGFSPQPACQTGESCVNALRYTDPNSNAVLGACMHSCNVFDSARNTCPNVGSTAASCVPTEASGELQVSTNGDGICVPQRTAFANLGQPCSEVDAFRGAACGSGQLCTSVDADAPATCIAVCDLDCNPADGGAGPSRCNTEPNARCSGGTRCRRVTSTTGARVGFCL